MKRSWAINLALKSVLSERCVAHGKFARSIDMRPEILSRILSCKRPVYAHEFGAMCKALGIRPDEMISLADKHAADQTA